MPRKDIFGPKSDPAKRAKRKSTKTKRARWLGPVSTARAPKRILPTAVGAGPDQELVRLFDGARDLGEAGRRFAAACPDLPERERLARMRKFFDALNIRWLKSPERRERQLLAARNAAGDELDFIDDDC
jgi:hypothetical protein